jgi:hypothetical protein
VRGLKSEVQSMKPGTLVRRGLLLGVVLTAIGATQSSPGPASVPVLIELFTAEGCSSCPPADLLLSRLAKESAAGAQVIPLGLHVDYWDELGWKDPASMHAATDRQSNYARALGNGDRIYTPQVVVDGRDEMIGTDVAAIQRAIAKALKQPRASLTLAVDVDGDGLIARANVTGLPAEAAKESVNAVLAVTEDDLTNVVKRGENSGRTLHHDAVVRALVPIGSIRADLDLTGRATLKPEWRRDQLHAVVFLQGKKSQRIWGAATAQVH